MCSSNQPAGLQAGKGSMNFWENGCAQHCTSTPGAPGVSWPHSVSIFLIRFSFNWSISPVSFLHFLDKILSRYFQEPLLETPYHKCWEKYGRDLHTKDLSISYPIVCIFPSLLSAVTLGLVQNQSILTVLRNVLKMSLNDLLCAWPLESLMFWDLMSL